MSTGIDYRTDQAVRDLAVDLRKKHDALDWEATVDDLIELAGFEQGMYSPGGDAVDWLEEAVSGVTKKVKALVSLKKRVILLSTELHHARTPFAKGHELGHAELPWHRKILYVCDEHDLSLATQAQLEFEANAFASALLLPEDLLRPYYDHFASTMETVLLLKNRAGASIETTAYAYVRYHPRPCALLVLGETQDEHGERTLTVKSKAVSDSAVKGRLGTIERGQTLPAGHVVVQASLQTGGPSSCECYIGGRKDVPYSASVLNNSYKVFCLMVEKTVDAPA